VEAVRHYLAQATTKILFKKRGYMAGYISFIRRFLNADVKTIWKDTFDKKDPNVFKPNGSQIYHGMQGKGKTLSMVYHGLFQVKSKYPRAMLVSNLYLRDFKPVKANNLDELRLILETFDPTKEYLHFESYDQLTLLLKNARPKALTDGVIFMIDEIHNYFHSHDSKAMPMWIVQVFSQQRKQHLLILGTVQDWDDVIKAIRRQIDNLIACNRIGHLITNTVVDPREFENNYGERVAPVKKKGFFWLTEKVRNAYDTFQVINSGREIFGGADMEVKISSISDKPKSRFGLGRKNEPKYSPR
jgi:hypothetical protein